MTLGECHVQNKQGSVAGTSEVTGLYGKKAVSARVHSSLLFHSS
ncbi:hypothetical protein SBA7_930012 [Candidatus Sulfotelmatobacter sp. SbA7]|nr:hypothetical protein SBA7_930012 [Candidatus Sulfotelmatobacter sp. SbA7]